MSGFTKSQWPIIRQMLLLCSVSLCRCVIAQDIHFSQFTQSAIYLNPAAAGMSHGGERAELNYRQQWTSMGAPYRTMHAAFDMPVGKPGSGRSFLGAGVDVFSDKSGDANFGTTEAVLAVSGVLPLNDKNRLSAGLCGGAAQRAADFDKLQWGSQYYGHYDPNIPSNEVNQLNSFIYTDFGLGLNYSFINKAENLLGNDLVIFHAGAALFHANRPVQRLYSDDVIRLPRKAVVRASSRLDVKGSDYSFLPAFLFAYQKPATEVSFGSMLRYRLRYATKITSAYIESALYIGCFYRWKDAIIPQLRIEMGNFGLGFSYDINVSTYKEVSKLNGGLEFSLTYTNLRGSTIKTMR